MAQTKEPVTGGASTDLSGRRPGLVAGLNDRNRTRTAEKNAGFLLPHLKPGMSLLDVGCGPGSITVGLARAVSPGEVIGVDLNEAEIAKATVLAEELGVENVRFEAADVLKLPFDDGTFDAAFSNSVLMHISGPERAAREVFRVLKPGGVYGASDRMRGMVWGGMTPPMERFFSIYRAWTEHRGTDLDMGAKLRPLLRAAGFDPVEASALFNEINGTTERTRVWAQMFIKMVRETTIRQFAHDEGLADEHDFDEMTAALEAWGDDPDSFSFHSCGEALGWKPAGP